MNALNDQLVDPLVRDWNEASHKDEWQVPVVYETTFRKLVANELGRQASRLRSEAEDVLKNAVTESGTEGFAVGVIHGTLLKQARHLEARVAELRGEQS